MNDKQASLATSLNCLWTVLTLVGVKHMPRLVFDDWQDWMAATEIIPPETLLAGNWFMLAGFRFDYHRQPINEADRFVAQEIGA